MVTSALMLITFGVAAAIYTATRKPRISSEQMKRKTRKCMKGSRNEADCDVLALIVEESSLSSFESNLRPCFPKSTAHDARNWWPYLHRRIALFHGNTTAGTWKIQNAKAGASHILT